MFVIRDRPDGFIELAEGEERLYRLPPISQGRIVVQVFESFTTTGPKGELVIHNAGASDLELELKHSEHLTLTGSNGIIANSLWVDDLWRLRVRRLRRSPVVSPETRRYRVRALYPSLLPVLERRVAARFFHDGFEDNWNRLQYLKMRFTGHRIEILVDKDLAALYGIDGEGSGESGFVILTSIDTQPVSFVDTVNIPTLELDVGAGPNPVSGDSSLFFSVRGEFPELKVSIDVPFSEDPQKVVDPFHITLRFYLWDLGDILQYVPHRRVEPARRARLQRPGGRQRQAENHEGGRGRLDETAGRSLQIRKLSEAVAGGRRGGTAPARLRARPGGSAPPGRHR